MSEFFYMGGYAFYVWTSLAIFCSGLILDLLMLRTKQKTVRRNIVSLIKRDKKLPKS